MKGALAGVVAVVAAGGVAVVVERKRLRAAGQAGPPSGSVDRWLAVTVNRQRDAMWPDGRVPGPLGALGTSIEVELRPAPGDKGTEVRARLRGTGSGSAHGGGSGAERVRRLRRALRETKQLVEVGEVLRVDPVPHGERKHTPAGAVVERATDRAPEEGLL